MRILDIIIEKLFSPNLVIVFTIAVFLIEPYH